MKRNYFIHLISLFLVVFSSCQKADDSITIKNDKLPMSVIARIGDVEPASARYAGTLNNATFIEGDAIGIFMDGGNVIKWTLSSIKWEPATATYWPETDVSYTFKAFYPYEDEVTYSYSNIPMPSLLEQNGTFDGIVSRDFLVASTTQNYGTSGTVVFQGEGKAFNHVSALVHLTILDSDDLADATLTGISIEGGNIVAPSSYSFETSSVTLSPNSNSDLLSTTLTQEMDKDQDYYFVLNAKSTESNNVKLSIQYTTNGKDYIAESNSFSNNIFTSGKQHNFTVNIKDKQLSITEATINPWTDSENTENIIINNPQEFENEESE